MNNDSIGEELKAFFEVYALDADGYQHENGPFDRVQVIAHDDLEGLLLRRKGTFYRITAEEVDILAEDRSQDGNQLDHYYNPNGDGEHPLFSRADWRQAVTNDETLYGYWAWVARSIWEETEEKASAAGGIRA